MSDENEHNHEDEHPPHVAFFGPSPAQLEQMHLQGLANAHETKHFFDSLDEVQLRKLSGVLSQVIDTDGAAGNFFLGWIRVLLEKDHGVCSACGQKHGDELNEMLGAEQPEQPRTGPEDRVDLMREYGVEQDDDGSLRVMCLNCKLWYETLEDRMLRPPGKPGCHGCIQKEKFG